MFLLLILLPLAWSQWSLVDPAGAPLLTTDPNAQIDNYAQIPMWCVGSNLYLYGSDGHMWKYETLETSRYIWMPNVTIPPRTSAMAWTLRNVMYVYGGLDSISSSALNDLWSYSDSTRTATRLVDGDAPTYGAAYWIHPQANRLYIWGGVTNSSQSIRAYDVTTGQWATVTSNGASTPPIMPYASATISNDGYTTYLYVNDHLWELDMSTFTWSLAVISSTSNPPGPNRRNHVLWPSPVDDSIYLYGGVAGSLVFGDTWNYSPNSKMWRLVTGPQVINPSPLRQDFSTCVNTNNSLYLFGGTNAPTNDLWLQGPVPSQPILRRLELGLYSATVWAFISAVLSGMVVFTFLILLLYLAIRACKRRMSKKARPLASPDNLNLL